MKLVYVRYRSFRKK